MEDSYKISHKWLAEAIRYIELAQEISVGGSLDRETKQSYLDKAKQRISDVERFFLKINGA